MCACEPGFTCSRCRDRAMDDDHVIDHQLERLTVAEQEQAATERADLEQRGIR